MIKELIDSNCIKIGKWKLKNGETSKYYFAKLRPNKIFIQLYSSHQRQFCQTRIDTR